MAKNSIENREEHKSLTEMKQPFNYMDIMKENNSDVKKPEYDKGEKKNPKEGGPKDNTQKYLPEMDLKDLLIPC